MTDPQRHPYEDIPLDITGYVLAAVLIAGHLWMLLKPTEAKEFLTKFSRNYGIGRILMAVSMLWFWLLVTPAYIPNPLSFELGDFNGAKNILLVVVPLAAVLVIKEVREFLAVRALGLFLLMVAAPLLAGAFLEPHPYKNLVSFYSYALIIAGLFFIGMPYLFRDMVKWATDQASRFRALSIGGLIYGIAVLLCTIVYWGKEY